MLSLCIVTRGWPGQLIRVIIIVIAAAASARWDPPAALPLIAGITLGGWILAGLSRPAVETP